MEPIISGRWLRRSQRSLACLIVAGLISSCATKREVEDIVLQSNVATIAPELGLTAAGPADGPPSAGWKAASARIEQFIATHPDNAATVAALRLRQATLLLQNRQFNLAEAAFNQADRSNLHSSRDRAIKDLQGTFLWWYQNAGEAAAVDSDRGVKEQAAIHQVWMGLKKPEDEGIRDFLSSMSLGIGLKMANDTTNLGLGRLFFTNSLNAYSAMLPPGETTNWTASNLPTNATLETATSGALRRRFRVEDGLEDSLRVMSSSGNGLTNAEMPSLAVTNQYFRSVLGFH
jgi:hypothetical protein